MTVSSPKSGQHLVDTFPCPALAFSAKGEVTAANAEAEAILAVSAADLIGKKAWASVAGRRKPDVVRQLIAGDKTRVQEFCPVGDGTDQRFEAHVRALPDGGGVLSLLPAKGVTKDEIKELVHEVSSDVETSIGEPQALVTPPGAPSMVELVDAINRRVFAVHELALSKASTCFASAASPQRISAASAASRTFTSPWCSCATRAPAASSRTASPPICFSASRSPCARSSTSGVRRTAAGGARRAPES